MNILAHAVLSGSNEDLIIGNFIADFIKGNPAHPRHQLTPGVQRGIWLHRHIDSTTDNHPLVEQMRQVLRPRCHKYAGAALDVFLDHFLAVEFDRFAELPLQTFIRQFYGTIRRASGQLPPEAHRMADHMIRHDWLTTYQTVEGIDRVLQGLARRTTFPSNLDTASADLIAHYAIFADGFQQFFPQLQQQVRLFRASIEQQD